MRGFFKVHRVIKYDFKNYGCSASSVSLLKGAVKDAVVNSKSHTGPGSEDAPQFVILLCRWQMDEGLPNVTV